MTHSLHPSQVDQHIAQAREALRRGCASESERVAHIVFLQRPMRDQGDLPLRQEGHE